MNTIPVEVHITPPVQDYYEILRGLPNADRVETIVDRRLLEIYANAYLYNVDLPALTDMQASMRAGLMDQESQAAVAAGLPTDLKNDLKNGENSLQRLAWTQAIVDQEIAETDWSGALTDAKTGEPIRSAADSRYLNFAGPVVQFTDIHGVVPQMPRGPLYVIGGDVLDRRIPKPLADPGHMAARTEQLAARILDPESDVILNLGNHDAMFLMAMSLDPEQTSENQQAELRSWFGHNGVVESLLDLGIIENTSEFAVQPVKELWQKVQANPTAQLLYKAMRQRGRVFAVVNGVTYQHTQDECRFETTQTEGEYLDEDKANLTKILGGFDPWAVANADASMPFVGKLEYAEKFEDVLRNGEKGDIYRLCRSLNFTAYIEQNVRVGQPLWVRPETYRNMNSLWKRWGRIMALEYMYLSKFAEQYFDLLSAELGTPVHGQVTGHTREGGFGTNVTNNKVFMLNNDFRHPFARHPLLVKPTETGQQILHASESSKDDLVTRRNISHG
jgi:hypothetical protein